MAGLEPVRVKDFLEKIGNYKGLPLEAKTINFDTAKEVPFELSAIVKEFRALLPIKNVLLSGVDGRPPRTSQYDRLQRNNSQPGRKPWLSYDLETITRKYTIGLVVDKNVFGLADFLKTLPKSSEDYYEEFLKPVADFIKPQFRSLVPDRRQIERIRVGILYGPSYRIWFDTFITTSYAEFLRDAARAHLTSLGSQLSELIAPLFRELLIDEEDLTIFLSDTKVKRAVTRELENRVREQEGFHKIGEGYISETLLARLVTELYPSTVREKTFDWLGLQRLDIFVPNLRLAIEFHGEQHYEAIERFGGIAKLEKQKQLDTTKRDLCYQNGIILVEWPYWVKIERNMVQEILEAASEISAAKLCIPVDLRGIKVQIPASMRRPS